jgi:hypothetical protein
MQGLIGINVDALNNKITFAPKLPADWKFLKVNNIKIKNTVASAECRVQNGEMKLLIDVNSDKEIEFEYNPDFELGVEINSVMLNGKKLDSELVKHEQAYQLKTNFKAKGKNELVINYKPSIGIYLLSSTTPIGATNEGLKIISQKYNGNKLIIYCEGKSNRNYELGVMNDELICNITGGELKDGKLIINIPGNGTDFVKHKTVIEEKIK